MPGERTTAETLGLTTFIFLGLLALPAWFLGAFLGRKLEARGFWRGLGWCVAVALGWGFGIMVMVLMAALGTNAYHNQWDVFARGLMKGDTLLVQGVFLLGTASNTLLAGAITGGLMKLRRRREGRGA